MKNHQAQEGKLSKLWTISRAESEPLKKDVKNDERSHYVYEKNKTSTI
jgi:hypothetical protein